MQTADTPRFASLREFVVAAVVAGVLVQGTIAAAALSGGRARALDVLAFGLVVVVAMATVMLHRKAPVWALTIAMGALSAYLLAGYPYGPVLLCMIVGMYEVARRRSLRVSVPVCGLAAVSAYAMVAARFIRELDAPVVLSVAWLGWVVLPWSVGALVQTATGARERARQDLVARVALEQRMKIATEVHDVAGHGFALTAMQAGVALLMFDEQPEQARKSLEAIRAISTKSLTELRGMLETVHPVPPEHNEKPDDNPTAADTGLAGLPNLVDQVRAGGLPVRLDVAPVRRPLTGDIDAVAYRVVRESLTNVLRHAGETTADVRIAWQQDELVVRVADGGHTLPRVAARPGHGLIGMRSRVEDIGGRFEAGPREGGGFQVVAHLPLTVEPRGAGLPSSSTARTE